MPLRLLVFGGRHYTNRATVFAALDHLHTTRGIACIVCGGAPGADKLAADWARDRGVALDVHLAEWETYGKAAGPMRNEKMAGSNLDGGVQFPGGRGTADMRRRLDAAGVKVWEPQVPPDSPLN